MRGIDGQGFCCSILILDIIIPSLVAEYIFVFQKPADKKSQNNIYWNRSDEEKTKNEIDLKDYQGEKSKNVWKIRPLAPQENLHPCPFPLELAERVIQFYSYKRDVVIDTFAGSGQTNCAAEKLGRAHVGIETQQKYIDYVVGQLNNTPCSSKNADMDFAL